MKSKFAPGGYSVYDFLFGRSYRYLVRFLWIICFCIMGMQGAKAQGFGVSYSYSTTDIVRIDNATGALTTIFVFPGGTVTAASALAVDLNGDIYFTSDQVPGSTLFKFVPNPAPATGGVLSTIGTITPTINDGVTARNLVFGKLAIDPTGQLFTISNYSAVNTNNLASRPFIVNIDKNTANVTSATAIPLPSGGLIDLPSSGGDIDFSPVGRLFVSGSVIGAPSVPSIWEVNTATGAILGYKSVLQPPGSTFTNLSGFGFDLQGNVICSATLNSYILKIAGIEFSGSASWSGIGIIGAGSVSVLNGPLVNAYGDLGSNAFKILGRVFEDVNYGGGAGRPYGTAGTAGIPNVRVEVYDASGVLQNFTNTLADGTYVLGVSGSGVYYVRMVNGTAISTRPGSNGAELGIQTFRTESPVDGTLVNIVNEVGGRTPATQDPGVGSFGSTILSPGTFILNGGGLNGAAASVSQATIGNSNVAGIDFGLNFSTIVNANNTGQGSLKQFINNTNTLTNAGLDQVANSIFDPAPGVETSIFMIPDGAPHPGINKASQLTISGTGMTAIITTQNLLPQLTDDSTSIDGRTQTANIGNSQPGIAGHPGAKVGVDQIALPGVQRPEVELRWGGLPGTAPGGFTISGGNITIRGMAVYGFGVNGSPATLVNTANILITGSTNTTVTESIIGGAASSTNAEPVGTNPSTNILVQGGSSDLTITNNLIIRADYAGIYKDGVIDSGQVSRILPLAINNLLVSGNEILNNGMQTAPGTLLISAGIELDNQGPDLPVIPSNYTITNNSISGNSLQGMQLDYANTGNISNNSFVGNGTWPSPGVNQLTQLDNVFLHNCSDFTISRNIITGNTASGVAVLNSLAVRNRISQNSIYNNAGLGILLGNYQAPETVIPNDNGDADTGPNNQLNFPVIKSAAIVGNNLVLKGFSGPGTTIELFVADRDGSFTPTPPLSPNPLPPSFTDLFGFGEGRTYLFTLLEGGTVGGITDQDATTGVYTDDGTGVIGNRTENSFLFSIPLANLPGIALNSLVTATATDAVGNTSGFDGVARVTSGDMGDAPDSYLTMAASNGPVHTLNPGLVLGAAADAETDGNAVAAGADCNPPNGDLSDDALTAPLPVVSSGAGTYSLTFPLINTTGQTANLAAWLDFNRNGTFDPAEGVVITVPNNATTATVTWNSIGTLITGAGSNGGITYARLRLTSDPITTSSVGGLLSGGEVEDYSLQIANNADLSVTKTDNPDPVVAGQTLTYTITVTNAALSSPILTTDTIHVLDTLPAGFIATSYTAAAGTFNSTTGAWTGVSIPAGQSVILTIAGTVAANAVGTLTNNVTVTVPTGFADTTSGNNRATQVTAINRVADLTLEKTASPKPAIAGQALTYTITLGNNGPSSILTGDTTKLTDNLPAGFTANTFTASAGTYNSATGTWTGLSLTTGQSATLTIAGTVIPAAFGTLTNTVTALPPTGVTDPTPPTATDVTAINNIADLAVTKTDGSATYVPGNNVVYTIVVSNAGPSDVVGATVNDLLPAGITTASWTATPGAGAIVPANSGTGAINQLVSVPAGSSITYMLTLNVPGSFTGVLSNTATVVVPVGYTDNNPANNTATDNDTYNPLYSLSAVKTAPASVSAGTAIQYTVTFTNNGPSDLIGAAIADNIPASITGVTWTAAVTGTATVSAGSGAGNAVSLTGSLPAGPGNTIVLTVNGTVQSSATGIITNQAAITPPNKPAFPSNTTNTTVLNTTGINVVKTGPLSGTVSAGNTITYNILVTNAGPSDAVNAVIADAVPAAITGVTWTATAGGAATINGGSPMQGTGNAINFTATIPAGTGNQVSITVTGTIPAATPAGSVTNIATATPPGGTPVNSQAQTTITNDPGLVITKTGPATLSAGDNISYTIEVVNNGPSNAVAAVMADNIPVQVLNATWIATSTGGAAVTSGATGSGNTINVTGNIPAGAPNKITIVVTGKVDPSVTGIISNTATVTPANKPVQSSNEVVTEILNNPVLDISKSAPATISAGQLITYTLTLTNAGPSNVTGAQITDVLPAQISNIVVNTAVSGTALVTANTITGNTIQVTGNVAAGAGNSIIVTVSGLVDPSFTGQITNIAGVIAPGKPEVPSNPVTTTVTNTTDIRISKSGPASISAGQPIAYTITVANNGPSNAANVAIIDQLPAAIHGAVWTATTSGNGTAISAASGTGNINITGTLPAGAGNLITIHVTGTTDPAFSGIITNTAIATAPGTTPDSATVNTSVTNDPEMLITKSGPASISAGQQITYTVQVTNAGFSDAVNASITDNIPAGILGITWSAVTNGNGTTVTNNAGTGNVNITGNIPAGAGNNIIITIHGTVDPAFTGDSLKNTATTLVPGKSPVSSNTVTSIVTIQPTINVVKSGPDILSAGAPITYTIDVTNSGPSNAVNLAIADILPVGLLNITWTATTTGAGTTVSNNAGTGNVNITGNIPAGTGNKITITLNGAVDPAYVGILTNIVTATMPGKTPVTSSKNTEVTNDPDMQVSKTGPAIVVVGQPVTYNITVTNNGASNATNVSIVDQMPVGLQQVTWTATVTGTGTSVSSLAGTGNINITGNIPAGAGKAINIAVTGLLSPGFSGTLLENTVTTVAPGKQPESSTTIAEVRKVSDLQIQKSGPQQIVPGENVTYTILVTNNGPGNAINATINDVVPAALQNVSWTAATNGTGTTVSAAAGTGNNIALTGNIPAGVTNSITIVVTGKLDPATMLGQISNTATATPATGTTDPTPASSTVTSTISRQTDLVIVKSGPANKGAGQAISYQLLVTNNGPSDVTGAIIKDIVPAQITGVTYTTSVTGSAQVTTAVLTGNTLNITGNIAAGAGNSMIVNVNGIINPNTAPGNITNTATVTPPAGTTETQPASNTSTVITAVSTNVGLLISKSGPAIANTGDSITYTIEVSNTGATNATNVGIADNVPPDITGVTWTAMATGHGGTTITATAGTGNTIAFNANIEGTTSGPGLVTITVKGVVSPVSDTSIINTATATFNGVIHSTVTTAINNAADLRIVKTGPDSIAAGQVITYILDVTNAGPASVLNAIISDLVPAQVHNVSWKAIASGGASLPVATGTGNQIDLHADIPAQTGHVSVTITGQIDAAYVGMLTNTATATPPAGNPDPTPATSTVNTTVLNEPALQVVKSGPATIAAGQQIVYTVVVTNTGASDATNVHITDVIPATVKNPAWIASANGAGATISNGNSGTGNLVNVTGNLLAGVTGEIRITVTGIVDSSFIGRITNMASATPQGGTTVNSAPVITTVTNKATLHIVKSGPATIAAGQNITYSLVVTNSGPSNATAMSINDIVPAAIQNVTWNATTAGTGAIITGSNNGTGNSIHITGSLKAGADSIRVMITGIVNPDFKGLITNTAMAGTAGAIPDSSTVRTQVINTPGIHVDKSGPGVVNAGAPIIYTIDVTNAGPSNAANVSINDLVPVQIQQVTWIATAAGSGTNITGNSSGTGNGINLTANIAAGAGNKISITVNGIVDPAFIGSISNVANAIVPGDTPVVSIPVVTQVNNTPALHITKSGPATALSNDSITYIITVSNTGPSEAIGAVITDAVPAAILHPNWSVTTTGNAIITAGATGTGPNVSVTANIPAGAANIVTITVRGRIVPDYNGMVKNAAVVTPPGKPPVTTDTTITHVKRAADIRIVKSGPGQIAAGGNITYTIDVTNAGPATADSVTITDIVPAAIAVNNWNAAMISGTGAIHGPSTGTGNQISILASLNNTAHMRITITGMVAQQAGSPLINTAKAVLPPGIVDPTPVDTSTVVTVVVQQPGVQLRKTGPDTAHAGEIIHYTITATNIGPSDAAAIVIKDIVPALLQQVSWNATTTGNASIISGTTGTGNNILLTGNIAAGNNNAISIMITGKIPADYAGGLSNIATVTVPGDTSVIKTPPVITNVTKEADLWITKTGPATIIQGKTITYLIAVGNTGPSTAHNATIQDILPAGIDSIQATLISQSGGAAGTVLTVNNNTVSGIIDSIPAGGLVNIEIKGRVTGIATLNNKATVTPPADVKDPVPGNNTTPVVVTTVIPISKLSITKTVSPDAPYGIGQTVTYTLHIKNEGPGEINPVQVTDVMSGTPTDAPVLGTPEIGTATYNAAVRTITWNAGLMTNGQSATLSYTVTLPAAGSVNNVAIVKGPVDISIPDTARITIPVGSYTDLGITKTGPATIIQGQIITYEIVVTNHGASAANGAVIHDVVPAGIGSVTANVSAQSGGAANTVLSMNGNDLHGTIGTFPAGATVTIAIRGMVDSAGILSNVAHIVTPPGVVDTIPRNDSTPPVITVVTPTAQLRILKTVAPVADTYSPGDKVTYTLKVTNNGPGAATGVIVTDVMTSNIVSVPTLGTPGTGVATFNPVTQTITWNIGAMANGQSTSLSYEVTLLDTGRVKNVAIVTGTRDIVKPDSTQHIITVGRSADLIVHKKIITAAPYTIGQQVDYSVDITNAGPNNASGITVTDILPAGALATPSHIIVSKGQAVYDPASNTILWTMDSLHTGEIATLTFHTELTATGDITNKAVISGKEPDPDLPSNTAISVITVGGDIFIPNTITPNGDGKNDHFVIQGLSKYPGSSLFIYNRWGNMVYQSRNYDNSWNGEGLNEGTYYYILKLNAPQGERAYKGWIELLR